MKKNMGSAIDEGLMLASLLESGHRSDYVSSADQGVPLPRITGGLLPSAITNCQAAVMAVAFPTIYEAK
jgi:hypothetical protein